MRTGAAVALFVGLAAGGYGIASAAGGSGSAASTTTAPQGYFAPPDRDHGGPGGPRGERTALTGDTLAKATAAAVVKVPGATVEGAFAHEHGDAKYVVVMKKADGSRVAVHLDAAFAVLSVDSGPGKGRGDGHGPGGPRAGETALTGDTLAKVTAAAKAKVPGATVDRAETDADGNAKYEVHMTKADGTHVTVYVDAAFAAVKVETMPERPGGPGGRPHP